MHDAARPGNSKAAVWDDQAAAACSTELELRALASRWLGGDTTLTLYGGGNTSLKTAWTHADGTTEPCLYVKGSGADLAEVVERDFTPIRQLPAVGLLDAAVLDNVGLMAALAPLKLDAASPRPSIETLLHASIPARFVEHTHADTVLAIINTEDGERVAREVFGDAAPWVPFRHSGFDLALACHQVFAARCTSETIGLILASHGIVAFGDTARESFDNMLSLVQRARTYLEQKRAWTLPRRDAPSRTWERAVGLARLRASLSRTAGFPVVLCVDDDPEVIAFVSRPDLAEVARQGPPTPQHAVFTKRWPALGLDVDGYAAEYRAYCMEAGGAFQASELPDPAPRILLDPAYGMIALSVDGDHARRTANVYRHDIEIITRASGHSRYRSLPADAILAAEVHYGGFDRQRLARRGVDLPLLGCIVGCCGVTDPALTTALTAAGADVVPLHGSRARTIDLVYGLGGLDACVLGRGGTDLIPEWEVLLSLSPCGGIVVTRDEFASPGTVVHTIAARWNFGSPA
jgi:rhamnose utilization protein RhaD (predicted bifunctional aldolase and dehydrogenase)